MAIKIGTKAKFSFNHLFQTITYSAVIRRINDDGTVWVEIPRRLRELKPCAPLGGKRFGKYRIEDLRF